MTGIRRRRALEAICGTAGAVLAGCLDGQPDPPSGDGVTITSMPPGAERPTDCPEYDDVQRVTCYDAVDVAAVPAFLDPSRRSVGTAEPIEFSLRNQGERRLATNFYNRHLHKHVDGEWYHVAPRRWTLPLMNVPPGERHTWTVTFYNERIEAGSPVPFPAGTEDLTVAGVGGGHYAFRGRGEFGGENTEGFTAFAATFTLDAEPVSLTPTNAIQGLEREGDTLVARSDRGDPDDERSRLGALELERIDAPAGEPRRLIVEQIVRDDQLRDVLALATEHGVDRVRLEEDNETYPVFGSDTDRTFEFQGSSYEVTTSELEDPEQSKLHRPPAPSGSLRSSHASLACAGCD